MDLYNHQKSITDFLSTVNNPENYFSIDDFFPDDEKCRLVSVRINAIELAKYLHPDKMMWVDIETIFIECCLNDMIEILPNLQADKLIESDEIDNLSIEDSITLLTQLKQRRKYYEVSAAEVTRYLKKHSLESHKDWKTAVNDVTVDLNQLPVESEKKAVRKIVVNFYDPDGSLNENTVNNYITKLDFYKYDDIKYEYNVLKKANNCLVESIIYFYPDYIGFQLCS